MPKIGAHVSTAGGLLKAIDNAQKIGANCLQIFSSAPQQWQGPRSFTDTKEFKNKVTEKNLLPVFVHGTYLINMFSDLEENRKKSTQALIEDLLFCEKIGAEGVVFHMGSHADGLSSENVKKITDVLVEVDKKTPPDIFIILENAAGSGSKIGGKMAELAEINKASGLKKIRYCLDTAHAFAAGYNLENKPGIEEFFQEVEKNLDWEKVAFFHLNDSKKECNSHVDRHENIGAGKIGNEGLSEIARFAADKKIPLILETPGFEGEGPDLKNMEIVKDYLNK